ncbi:MAG: hypothetical protein FWB96_04610 [Defluviitaleaceae bacterium]|nr:hypothetical protein [Defluviitaleaceae bacterium]MCL2262664.1 hypothetical protein [Defluviitaleaceae bacterium]
MNIDKELLAKAEHDTEAMIDVGIEYDKQGDYQNAALWWEKAAEKGNQAAMSNLIQFMYGGRAAIHDGKKLFYWLEKFAETGYGWAQVILGTIYCGVKDKLGASELYASEIEARKNSKKGIELIESGMHHAENVSLPVPDFRFYLYVSEAYRECHKNKRKGISGYEHANLGYLEASLLLKKKARNTAAALPDDTDNKAQLLELIDEMIHELGEEIKNWKNAANRLID